MLWSQSTTKDYSTLIRAEKLQSISVRQRINIEQNMIVHTTEEMLSRTQNEESAQLHYQREVLCSTALSSLLLWFWTVTMVSHLPGTLYGLLQPGLAVTSWHSVWSSPTRGSHNHQFDYSATIYYALSACFHGISRYALNRKAHMGSLTCATVHSYTVCCAHEGETELTSLHKCWLRSSEKRSFNLTRTGVEPMSELFFH